jgi:hypothetical protein
MNFNNKRIPFTGKNENMNLNKNITKLINNRLSNEYIAGIVHGEGSFSINLNFRKSKRTLNKRIYLQPVFILTQHNKNYDLIENIIKRFKNVGHYQIDNNNIIRYRFTDLEDIVNVIIPFFEKNKLMYEKNINFIKFKYVVNKLLIIEKELRWFNFDKNHKYYQLFIDLITISTHMNELSKSSIQLSHFNEKEKEIIQNNKLSLNILEELNTELKLITKKELNIDFINGLFDSNGWITIVISLNKYKNLSLALNYGIISNVLNSELIYDLKDYFNVGTVYKKEVLNSSELGENNIKYLVNKKNVLLNILPKIYNTNNYHEILINNENIKIGPIINNKKIISIIKILDLFEEYKIMNNNNEKIKVLNQILYLSYEIRDINLKNKESFNSYLIRMNKKLKI